MQRWSAAMDRVFAATASSNPLADEVILLPVQVVVDYKLSPDRRATVHADDIDAMNADLAARLDPSNGQRSALSIAGAPAFNSMVAGAEAETEDGLHFSDTISRLRATLVYNFRCADVLPKKFPLDKTCCSAYPQPNFIQLALLAFFLLWGPLGFHFHHSGT
jgi:hypothetical protein